MSIPSALHIPGGDALRYWYGGEIGKMSSECALGKDPRIDI